MFLITNNNTLVVLFLIINNDFGYIFILIERLQKTLIEISGEIASQKINGFT